MPKEKTQGNVTVQSQNDNATQRVPENEKKGFCSIAFVAAGYCICMSGLYTGAAMGFGMNFKEAILAVIVGNVILSVYGGLIGAAGAREGVSTSMLARHTFGREGSKVIGILLAAVMAAGTLCRWDFSVQPCQPCFPTEA